MRYFRRPWDESRGDEYDSWGTCLYFVAVDDQGDAHEQIEVYANGNVLAYDHEYEEDPFGGLTYATLDLEEFGPYEVTEREFRKELAGLRPLNR
ncbi:hypothetical protein [Planotetraspora kaengkrachanensis]|uniref:Uncharacterized protein n=1 Tax=Planotetraspora kaengkrachanensis TaxID=575193 RepID=A0A8J3V9W5_9ACTN|nr:hypothetical protein [Planotetraspora kaengkrachanensis]GIG82931.1 hypothetical protein Pka01_60580 [Planotetraspora kaengkrachanensis]